MDKFGDNKWENRKIKNIQIKICTLHQVKLKQSKYQNCMKQGCEFYVRIQVLNTYLSSAHWHCPLVQCTKLQVDTLFKAELHSGRSIQKNIPWHFWCAGFFQNRFGCRAISKIAKSKTISFTAWQLWIKCVVLTRKC